MKKFLLSTVALATMTAGAMAADLPARRMAPAPYVAVPVFTWTGFYVGANVGAAWNGNRRDNFGFGDTLTTAGGFPVVPVAGGSFFGGNGFLFDRDRDRTSILGGVQAGYNWQVTPGSGFVLGIEGDIQWMGNNNNNRNGFFGGAPGPYGVAVANPQIAAPVVGSLGNVAFFGNGNNNGLLGRGSDNDWFATVRLRAGYAVDRALFYVTGGIAFKDSDDNNHGFLGGATNFGGTAAGIPAPFFAVAGGPTVVATNNTFFGNNDNNNIGWALGGGVEYAFTNSLSAKIEYLHVEFDRNKNNFAGTRTVGVTNTGAAIVNNGNFSGRGRNNGIDLVRVGLNFRFSGF
jgi:outer membrane immunogenic protein